MTFLEAAIEVLGATGRPMHFRDIAKIAIDEDLLSHIGKTPEQTMQTRLSTALRRSPKGSDVVRSGPGIYALRAWGKTPPGEETKGKTKAKAKDKAKEKAPAKKASPPSPEAASTAEGKARDRIPAKKAPEPRPDAPAAEAGAGKGDKDRRGGRKTSAPVPGGAASEAKGEVSEPRPDAPTVETTATAAVGEGGKVPSEPPPLAEPATTDGAGREETGAAAGSAPEAARQQPHVDLEERRRRRGEGGGPRSGEGPRSTQEAANTEPSRSEGRPKRRRKRRRRNNGGDHATSERSVDVAEAAYQYLTGRGGGATLSDLASSLRGRGVVNGEAKGAERGLSLALAADNAAREAGGHRGRFVLGSAGELDLTDRVLGERLVSSERRVLSDIARLAGDARLAVRDRISRLPLATLLPVVKACLVSEGMGAISVVKISGDREAKLLSRRGPAGGGAVAVLVLREGSPEGVARRVAELRGSLHEHDATAGLLVTPFPMGEVARSAVKVPGAPAVTLWDADDLVGRMARLGLGFRTLSVQLPMPDPSFLGEVTR